MMKNEDKQNNERPSLRLIQGGAAEHKAKMASPRHGSQESQLSMASQAERLRQAILRLTVDEFGQTVDQVLAEINEKLDSEAEHDYARLVLLRHNLQRVGLMFVSAAPFADLKCNGYLQLADCKRLIACYPQLAELQPGAHEFLTFGELPPSQRCANWTTRFATVPIVRRNLRFGIAKVDDCGYFDSPGTAVWAQESNWLRRSIREMHLDGIDVTAGEALSELCNSLDEHGDKQRDRVDDLTRALEAHGLSFIDATEDLSVAL